MRASLRKRHRYRHRLPSLIARGRPPAPVAVLRTANNDATAIALWLHGRCDSTTAAYLREIRRLLDFTGAKIREITIGDVQAHGDHLAARGLAPDSRARALAAVRSRMACW